MAWRLRSVPTRAFKRLISFICIWASMCYLVFRLGSHPEVDDNSLSLSEKEILFLLSSHSNLPLAYWTNHKNKVMNNNSCVEYPSAYELDFNNIYWQTLQTSNGTFYFYGAYYDNRWRAGPTPIVRVLGMVDRINPIPITCQLWFDKLDVPLFSPATYTYGWNSEWGNYEDGILQPYVINCKVPKNESNGLVPDSVSLVEHSCDKPATNLRVLNIRPPKKEDFAVCVKALDFLHEDLSVRLVEWIELLNILGAKKLFMYELEMHPNITKVLRYYQKQGLVDLTKVTLPGKQPNLPGFRHLYLKNKVDHKRQNEVIPYNDCLYRNLYSYEHIILLDVDEVIMPIKHTSWKDLMQEVVSLALKGENYTRASYNVRNVYFLDDPQGGDELRHEAHELGIPRYLHMLQHVYRSKNFTNPGEYVKCFHNTGRVVSLHNHFPLNCLGTCTDYSIGTNLAQLQHYRKDCVNRLKKECETDFRVYTVRDTTIWRYKEELIRRTTKVLTDLGFLK